MKRIIYIILCGVVFLTGYTIFLSVMPVNKKGFYSNEDRVEAFLYSKGTYPVVIVGSSLSGVLDKEELFNADYFSLYTTGSGGCTGVEMLRKMKRVIISIDQVALLFRRIRQGTTTRPTVSI